MTTICTLKGLSPVLRVTLVMLLLALLVGACAAPAAPAPAAGDPAADPAAPGGPIQIGSKDFTEAIVVAEMYAQLLEQAGFTV